MLKILRTSEKELEKDKVQELIDTLEKKCFDFAYSRVDDNYKFKIQGVRYNIQYLETKIKAEKKEAEDYHGV